MSSSNKSSSSSSRMLVEYVRDRKKNPFATLVVYKTDSDEVRIGWSKYAEDFEKVPFTKKAGKEYAIENSKKNVMLVDRADKNIISTANRLIQDRDFLFVPAELRSAFLSFAARALSYFKKSPCNICICNLQSRQSNDFVT